MSHDPDHTHDHEHGHDHGGDGHDHHGHAPHPRRPDSEDVPLSHHMALTEAITDLLLAKGIIEREALRRTLEVIDQQNPADGARMIARAWNDEGYRGRLLADANAAAAELGIDAGGIPIRAVADAAGLHNVIVCTLCSCYPRFLLGASPEWYKSRAYRSRVVREPRAVLREFGVDLPASIDLAVHDSTAELRYLVLPLRPAGTEGWDEPALAAIVTRDCMIGVALPQAG